MIPDAFWEHMVFPLIVFAVGFLTLVLEAWMPLTVLALITAVIWFVAAAQRR